MENNQFQWLYLHSSPISMAILHSYVAQVNGKVMNNWEPFPGTQNRQLWLCPSFRSPGHATVLIETQEEQAEARGRHQDATTLLEDTQSDP